jgi:hypothetical protein
MGELILDEKEIISQYEKLRNINKVADYFNMSRSSIIKVLKMCGVDVTNRRYYVNHKYFEKIDTEEKAYWLGFLYADGYIRERKSGCSLELKLSVKDNEHLELFRRCLDSNHKIVYGVSKVNYKNGVSISHLAHLAIYSKELVNHIKSHGFHSRKTFTITKPNLNSDLLRHFIRGYFDGDGSVSFKPNAYIKTEIACASSEFQQFIINELGENDIKINLYSGFNLQIQNKVGNRKFYDYIYNGAKIYLKRKKDKYEEFRRYNGYDN